VAAAGVVLLLLLLVGVALRNRTGGEVATVDTTETSSSAPPTVPSTAAPTTAAPVTTVSPTASVAPATTPAPTPAPPPVSATPGQAVVYGGPEVQQAAGVAQAAGTALAAGDWGQARALVANLPGDDRGLQQAWGGLDAVTMVAVDARDTGGGGQILRLGEIAHETVNGQPRTSLYCVTWTVAGGRVTSMADMQVIGQPWRTGWVDPSEAVPVITSSCRRL
jgi:hypothetical protein